MSAKTKKLVKDYLMMEETTPLFFSHGYMGTGCLSTTSKYSLIKIRKEELDYDYKGNLKLKSLILNIIKMTDECASIDKDGTLQCTSGRRRSSLDIWRHCLPYIKDVEIFDVMNALYELNVEDELINSDFCSTILRTVFWIADASDMEDGVRVVSEDDYNDANYRDDGDYDEYGITFDDWKAINS